MADPFATTTQTGAGRIDNGVSNYRPSPTLGSPQSSLGGMVHGTPLGSTQGRTPTPWNPLMAPNRASSPRLNSQPASTPQITNRPITTPQTLTGPPPTTPPPPTSTGTAQSGTANKYNPLTFTPLQAPGLPGPYQHGDDPNYQQNVIDYAGKNPGGNANDFQQILNNEQIQMGNRGAQGAVDKYNGQLKQYYDNGGANNKYGYTLPQAPPDLTQFYQAAPNATSRYIPPPQGSNGGGTWSPVGMPSTVAPWTPPSTWTSPNQGANAVQSGGQSHPNSQQSQLGNNTQGQSTFTNYINNVLGGNNQQQGGGNQNNQLTQLIQLLLSGGGGMNQPSHDIFGQYNPFAQFGGGLGNYNPGDFGNLNNSSFYFPQFM